MTNNLELNYTYILGGKLNFFKGFVKEVTNDTYLITNMDNGQDVRVSKTMDIEILEVVETAQQFKERIEKKRERLLELFNKQPLEFVKENECIDANEYRLMFFILMNLFVYMIYQNYKILHL